MCLTLIYVKVLLVDSQEYPTITGLQAEESFHNKVLQLERWVDLATHTMAQPLDHGHRVVHNSPKDQSELQGQPISIIYSIHTHLAIMLTSPGETGEMMPGKPRGLKKTRLIMLC